MPGHWGCCHAGCPLPSPGAHGLPQCQGPTHNQQHKQGWTCQLPGDRQALQRDNEQPHAQGGGQCAVQPAVILPRGFELVQCRQPQAPESQDQQGQRTIEFLEEGEFSHASGSFPCTTFVFQGRRMRPVRPCEHTKLLRDQRHTSAVCWCWNGQVGQIFGFASPCGHVVQDGSTH